MKIIKVKIQQVRPAAYNPRRDLQPGDKEYEALKRAMIEFGQVEPIVWNKRSGNLVGGHQRFKILVNDFKANVVDAVVVDLDPTREKALNVALNKIAGAWDIPKLKSLLVDLDDGSFDLELTGFDEAELKELIDWESGPGEGQTDQDAVPEPPKKAVTKPGDLWLLGQHRLLCGDCTSADVAALFRRRKAAFSFTSPPYSDQRIYAEGQNLDPAHLATCLTVAAPFCELFAVNLGLSRKANEVNAYWEHYIQAAKAAGMQFLSWNIWDKQESGSIGNQTAMFAIQHEWIFVFGQRKRLHRTVPNKNAGGLIHGTLRNKDGSLEKVGKMDVIGTHKQLSTIVSLAPVKARNFDFDHPAMFPVELPKVYIEACTQVGDVIYEPFAGSGTTLIAAENTQRQFFGIEINPIYCDVIVRRWQAYTGKKAVLDKLKAKAA